MDNPAIKFAWDIANSFLEHDIELSIAIILLGMVFFIAFIFRDDTEAFVFRRDDAEYERRQREQSWYEQCDRRQFDQKLCKLRMWEQIQEILEEVEP